MDCKHLGSETGDTLACPTCGHKGPELKVFECKKFGICTIKKEVEGVACCNGTREPGGGHEPCPYYTSRGV